MLKNKFFLVTLLCVFSSAALSAISIQELNGAPFSCKQIMISNSSDHLWKIEVPYKYVGKNKPVHGGSDVEWGGMEYIDVYPGANYRTLFSGPVDCEQQFELAYSWKGYDITAREKNVAKKYEEEREARNQEILRKNREHEQEIKRKEQEKIDEANRKKAEEAAKKLEYQQKLQKIKEQQAKSEYDRFEAYRSANESVCGAMIMQSDYVAACERRKAIHNDEQIREQAATARVREVDAARQRVEQDSNAEVARLTNVMEANNCSYGGGLSSQIPYPAWTSAMGSQEEYAAERKRIDALNWEAQQKFFRATKAASDACDARRANKHAIEQQREEALRLQAEQERRLLAQKKARADLDAAIQEGKKTISEAENNTQTMQNDNADLMNLINNIK